jgi:hypothetical protein
MRLGKEQSAPASVWAIGLVVASSALLACGGAEPAPADEPASLQAVLSIERMENASRAETSSASAMAQFVVLPVDADAHQTLDAAGLRTQLPERRGCSEAAPGASLRGGREHGQVFPEQLELLEAGEVSIVAGEMVTRLALNLFPPSGSASGVIYTTPDQSAALPPGLSYAIHATGSDAIPPLNIQQEAPSALRDVTIDGVPIERATALAAGQPLDFTWTEGETSDRVFVELSGADAAASRARDGRRAGAAARRCLDRRDDGALRLRTHLDAASRLVPHTLNPCRMQSGSPVLGSRDALVLRRGRRMLGTASGCMLACRS